MRGLIVGIVCVFALFFAGGFLASACDLRPEFENAIPPMLLVVMVCAVLFPTGRKRGGCWLGCGLWFVGGMGLLAAGSFFPHAPLSRPVIHEAAPVPRYLNGVTPTVDGVSIGMTAPEVRKLLGNPDREAGPYWISKAGTKVELYRGTQLGDYLLQPVGIERVAPGRSEDQDLVVGVEGRVLAQAGRELLQQGVPWERASAVLQPGLAQRRVFRREGYTFTIKTTGASVGSILLTRRGD